MHLPDIEFCNETSDIYKNIIDLCTTSITSLQKGEVERMYSIWNGCFNSSDNEDFTKSKNVISANYALPSLSCCLGIDFPTWINFKNSKEKRKRIMIVGIDPLRTTGSTQEVSIGTPYALHHKAMREGRTREYWKFIALLAQEYSVYITDIYKVFFYEGNLKSARSYNNKEFINNEYHHTILTKEIEIIDPNIIITMGTLATSIVFSGDPKLFSPISKYNVFENSLKYEHTNTDLIPMVHLSGASRGGQKAFLDANKACLSDITGKTNGDLYFQIIQAALNNSMPGN